VVEQARGALDQVSMAFGNGVESTRGDLELSLNTMPTMSLSDSDYWLDSGNVKGK